MTPLVILTGPTAVGKTALSIRLAKAINGEIISADSVQVYRGMDIGSAKITREEMEGIPHHLIDIMDPDATFDVSVFKELAQEAVSGILSRGHIPILVGGTGFYIQALLYDIDFDDASHDDEIRARYESYLTEHGEEALYQLLMEVDPGSCEIIHPRNTRRVIRALEYYELTRQPISVHNASEHEKVSPYRYAYFVLTDDRAQLYGRIEERIDHMIEAGLIDEVRRLIDRGYTRDYGSMKALGYKEIAAYLAGECSLEEAIYTLKRDTRHFAKRQLTWFKRERDVIYLDRSGSNDDRLFSTMIDTLKERKIIG